MSKSLLPIGEVIALRANLDRREQNERKGCAKQSVHGTEHDTDGNDICTAQGARLPVITGFLKGKGNTMGAVNRLAVAAGFYWPFCRRCRAQQMTAVTQLGWLRNGEYAPIMMAEAKGFFKEEGIDHKISMAAGQESNSHRRRRPGAVRPRRQRHDHRDGAARQGSRRRRRRGHAVPAGADLLPHHHRAQRAAGQAAGHGGKTGRTQVGTEFLFAAFAKKSGIDASKVKVVTAQATVEPLMAGKMDYFLGWIVNQTYAIEQEAAKPTRRRR